MKERAKIDPSQRCDCPGPRDERLPDNRRTGAFYMGRERCGLCRCFIVDSPVELRALRVLEIEADVRERGVWPHTQVRIRSKDYAYEWIKDRIAADPSLTQGQLRFDFCNEGLFEGSDSVFEKLVRRARTELGVVTSRGKVGGRFVA